MMIRWTQLITAAGACLIAWPAVADEEDAGKLAFFENRIRPVLVEHCYSCHSANAEVVKGGLLLDTRQGLLVGGDSGAALVPGKAEESLLLDAMRHDGLEMPPDRKLPDDVIADFSAWIRDGAIDPRDGEVATAKRTIDFDQGREFWCFQPIRRLPVPAIQDTWATTDIDQFIAAQQTSAESDGKILERVAEATPDILIRRLSFLLTGLPPTLKEQDDFSRIWAIDSDQAMETTVDRLLDSPRFGERW